MPFKILEERMVKYRRECDERVRKDVHEEVRRVREIEIAQVRIEEAANYRKERMDQINDLESELENMH